MIPLIKKEMCTGCGNCKEICPAQAISMKEDGAFLEAEYCEECGFCVPVCPADAIDIPFPLSTDKIT